MTSVAERFDALVIAAEWNEFCSVDLPRIKTLMRVDLLIDARNLYESSKATAAGSDILAWPGADCL